MTTNEQQREECFSEINNKLSKSAYNLAKNICNLEKPKYEQLDNRGKLLVVQKLENESDEDFRKRLSEKLKMENINYGIMVRRM